MGRAVPGAGRRRLRLRRVGRPRADALPGPGPDGRQAAVLPPGPGALRVRVRDRGRPRAAGVPRRLNEGRVADFLVPHLGDPEETLYEGVLRLPPATAAVVGAGSWRSWRYWSLDPDREVRLGSDGEYEEGLREVFSEAVRARLRSSGPVGSTLSGGLDSSWVTAVARGAVLAGGAGPGGRRSATYSVVFPERGGGGPPDRRAAVRRGGAGGGAADGGVYEPHYVRADGPAARRWPTPSCHQDEPFPAPNTFVTLLPIREAGEHGTGVLLSGHDGDSVVSYGYERLVALAAAGRVGPVRGRGPGPGRGRPGRGVGVRRALRARGAHGPRPAGAGSSGSGGRRPRWPAALRAAGAGGRVGGGGAPAGPGVGPVRPVGGCGGAAGAPAVGAGAAVGRAPPGDRRGVRPAGRARRARPAGRGRSAREAESRSQESRSEPVPAPPTRLSRGLRQGRGLERGGAAVPVLRPARGRVLRGGPVRAAARRRVDPPPHAAGDGGGRPRRRPVAAGEGEPPDERAAPAGGRAAALGRGRAGGGGRAVAPYVDVGRLRAAYGRFTADPAGASEEDLFTVFLSAALATWLQGHFMRGTPCMCQSPTSTESTSTVTPPMPGAHFLTSHGPLLPGERGVG